jgi:hypothetical protein
LLGTLSVNAGTVKYLYHGDQQQTNLLATYSRLLITEEDTNNVPSYPSPDKNTWRYYAELPQIPTMDKTRALDILRFLLSEDPLLQQLGIHGGLNNGLYENIQQVVELTDSINNSKDPTKIHHLVISILDYLDGADYVLDDVPLGTPLMADTNLSRVPIIDIEQSQLITSFLARISTKLFNLKIPRGVTQATNTQANLINLALSSYIQTQLKKARQDAKQLVRMSDTQLLQPSSKSIMIDMQTQMHNAFDGHSDLATRQEQKGFSQLSADIQRLATFDITAYKS